VTPLALNDLPLSVILGAVVEHATRADDEPPTHVRTFAGLRLGAPLEW
jgi:hypothetical protein